MPSIRHQASAGLGHRHCRRKEPAIWAPLAHAHGWVGAPLGSSGEPRATLHPAHSAREAAQPRWWWRHRDAAPHAGDGCQVAEQACRTPARPRQRTRPQSCLVDRESRFHAGLHSYTGAQSPHRELSAHEGRAYRSVIILLSRGPTQKLVGGPARSLVTEIATAYTLVVHGRKGVA